MGRWSQTALIHRFAGLDTPEPLGATLTDTGTRFVVFSPGATAVRLMLEGPGEPAEAVTIDLVRSGDRWHAEVDGVGPGWRYALQADGPLAPERGWRFAGDAVLLDPYAQALTAFGAERSPPRCIMVASAFDWTGDRRPRTPLEDTILYELHVRGFTRHPSAGGAAPGTYRGLVDRIPYLVDLGVTAVELLPVQDFDEHEIERFDPATGARLVNYWGYNPLALFAPKAGYAAAPPGTPAVDEFKSMVRAFHDHGIEVILDVVFNHTGESDATGPTRCFRGLANDVYYHLDAGGGYENYSGCGNAVNANHPVVSELIVSCLRHWVTEMGVDGFRFDLASVLARGESGELLADPPVLRRMAEDAVLKDVKLIAEPWDAAGAHQTGAFPADRFGEWNDRYRDDVRQFWRGDAGAASALATRLAGSQDLFAAHGPVRGINYVACHDGLTLRDVVSYSRKHNEANGEGNRDGQDGEVCWNCGVEGDTEDAGVTAARRRQVKNMLATLLLSQGVPMLLAGDELYRTQRGNNNAYCHDSDVSWIDWGRRDEELHRFTRDMIALRRAHPALRRTTFFVGKGDDVRWLAPDGRERDWDDGEPLLGCLIDGRRHQTGAPLDGADLFLIFHNLAHGLDWQLPVAPSGGVWRRVVDTAALVDVVAGDPVLDGACAVSPHSVVVLVATA